ADIGPETIFHALDLIGPSKLQYTHRPRVLAGSEQQVFSVFQKDALEEADSGVLLQTPERGDIATGTGVARAAPLELLGEAAVEQNGPQCGQFSVPSAFLCKEGVDLPAVVVHVVLPACANGRAPHHNAIPGAEPTVPKIGR